jgi:uncharacterized protein (TIGR02444 family)
MNRNNFSEFANQIHSNLQMKNILYHLQERLGMNVNVLLFCCWFACRGCRHLSKKDLQNVINAISPWHDQIVASLQKMLMVSNKINNSDWQKNISVMISDKILLAKQMEQVILAESIDRLPIERSSGQKIADACRSIATYSKELKIGMDQEDAEAIKRLLMHVFPDTDYTNLAAYWGSSLFNKRLPSFFYLQLPLNEL